MSDSTSSPSSVSTGSRHNNGSSTSSPLLFFVALGFGVVFTNLWIIVGVKYCFRYNQRTRAARTANNNAGPIDLAQIPPARRRRREKKLMSMEEVNERFPLTKYKTWRSSRQVGGLPAAWGVAAPAACAVSLQDERETIDIALSKRSLDSAHPHTAHGNTDQDHTNCTLADALEPAASAVSEKVPETTIERVESAPTWMDRKQSDSSDLNDDGDDPIRTAAPPEMLAASGDTCAICLDNVDEDDDVRGLSCGHAFHGSCVDPWLTGRRACCPLCKADYYIPKPRPEGEEPPPPTNRRQRRMPMPEQPPMAWIGRRGITFRPPRIPRPHLSLHAPSDRRPSESTRVRHGWGRYGARGANEASAPDHSTQRSWRTWRPSILAIPTPSVPRFAQRGSRRGQDGRAGVTHVPDLEAGLHR